MNPRIRRILILLALIALLAGLVHFLGERAPDPGAPPPAPDGSGAARPPPQPRAPGERRGDASRRRALRLPQGEAERDPARRAGAFEGRVISSARGDGIAGAELSFEHAGAVHAVVSGKDGFFQFEPPAPGVVSLAMVTAKGHHPFAPDFGESPITLIAREGEVVRGMTIALQPEIQYDGMVVSARGDPVAGAVVRVIGEPRRGSAAGGVGRYVADARGAFQFAAMDDALLEATHPDHAPTRARVSLPVQVSRRLVIRMADRGAQAAADEVLAGKVVNARGEPVEGTRVSARYRADNPAAPGGRLHEGAQAFTGEDGAFELDGLEVGRYDIVASDEGMATARAEGVPSGTRDLVLRLSEGGRLRGSVRDAARGGPVAAFSVVVSRHRGPVEREVVATGSFFDARGEYEVGGLLPGAYTVMAAARGYAPSAPAEVTIASPPEDAVTADFALGRGGRVTGVVLEEDTATPIVAARISVEGALGAGDRAVPAVAETLTDETGNFALSGVGGGVRTLTVLASGHHGRLVSGLVVSESGDIGPIRVELAKVEAGEEPRIELTGVGAVLSARGDGLVIGQVIAGGGAAEAGLGQGDVVVAIDGAPVVDLGFERAIQSIRGPEGSAVVLSVRKGGQGSVVDVPVRRRRVRG